MTGVAAHAGRVARGSEGALRQFQGWNVGRVTRLASVEDWVTFGLLLCMLWALGWSVWLADWGDLPSLLPTLTLGSVLAFALHRRNTHWSARIVWAVLLGFGVIMWQGSIPAEGSNLVTRASDAWGRFFAWLEIAREGGISTDTVPFSLMFMTASWITAYVVTAITFATRNPWAPVALLGLGLMTNLSYRQGLHEQTFYLFIIAAIAIFAHITTVRRLQGWRDSGVEYPSSLRWLSVRDGALLAGVVVLIAVLMPLWEPRSESLKGVWETARSPIDALREPAGRLLAGVGGGQRGNLLGVPDQNLAFKGPISLTDEPLFWVRSRYMTMFPGRVYQQYTSQGWITGPTTTATVETREPIVPPPVDLQRQRLEQVIQPLVATELTLPVSGVYETDRTTEIQYLEPPRYTVPLTGAVSPLGNLPADLRDSALDLRLDLLTTANLESDEPPGRTLTAQPAMSVAEVEQAAAEHLPEGVRFTVLESRDNPGLAEALVLERNAPREQVGVKFTDQVPAEQSYAITTYVVTATDQELAQAGDDYPAYITDRYLQLPESLPGEVRDLAQGIVNNAGAVTPFEKVSAIKSFLQDQEYSQEIEGPAPNVDGVYYFLFQTQQEPCAVADTDCHPEKIKGYSQYFGSAATVLLRSVGVPARMVSGWAAGDYNAQNGRFLVRDSHRHGWSQVYFPEYGWTDVEVTPEYTPPDRDETFSVVGANIFSAGSVGSAEEDPDFAQDQADLERLAQQAQQFAFEQLQREQQDSFPWWSVWTGAGVIATMVVIYVGWWISLRGMRPGRRSYAKLNRVAWLLGLGRSGNQSPGEFARTLARISPTTMEAAVKICNAFVIETYGRPGAESGERGELEAAWRKCARGMIAFRARQLVGMSPEIGEARNQA